MKDAEHNLLEFYRKIGEQNDYSFRDDEYWSVVSAPAGYWPSLVINLDSEEETNQLLEKMAEGIRNEGIPSLFISGAGQFGPAQGSVLKHHHFYPVDKWTVMEKGTSYCTEHNIPAGVVLRPLRGLAQIRDFTSIVNAELFRTLPADHRLLHGMAESDGVALYGCFSGNELVSGMLVLTSGNTAGLYLVVTRKERQRSGFGSLLLSHVAGKMKEAGVSKIVLHSSLQAVSFYQKNGFTVRGEMYIYRYSTI